MKEHGTIEKVLEKIEETNEDEGKKKKYIIPSQFLYKESRHLFQNPDVIGDKETLDKLVVFDKPHEEEMKEWLTGSKGFAETKVFNGIEKLKKSQAKKNQSRLDCFFKAGAVLSSSKKVEAPKGKGGKPLKKGRKSAA